MERCRGLRITDPSEGHTSAGRTVAFDLTPHVPDEERGECGPTEEHGHDPLGTSWAVAQGTQQRKHEGDDSHDIGHDPTETAERGAYGVQRYPGRRDEQRIDL